MPAETVPPAAFRVGDWTVEPALNQLCAGGRTAKIEPKAMAVLCHLAERPGEAVTRETLLATAWAGVIVGDDALTQVIVKLRKALRDVPGSPTYIQTISKGGYRLVAPVIRPDRGQNPQAQAQTQTRAATPHGPWPWRAASAALAAIAVAGWWLAGEPAAGPDPGQSSAPLQSPAGAPPTVAIRPFEPLGRDALETVLARGLTADLITDLSKVAGMWVVNDGPTRTRDAPASAYVVSGTVQRSGDRIRLQVHLTDARSAQPLWTERFDRTLTNLFDIQDELGPRILRSLPVRVSEVERRRVAQRHTRNLDAYETFHRGQTALHVRRKAENETARVLFRRAIDLDPMFARAYAGLALTYAADFRNQWVTDGKQALERALELAQTANDIDPEIPETHWVLGFVHAHRHEFDSALRELQTAVRLNASFADGYALMGGIQTSLGRPAEAIRLLRTAMRLAPESGYLYFMLLGRAYLSLGDLEQARLNLEQSLARNPQFLDARVYLAAIHVTTGDNAAAAWEAEEIRALQPGFTVHRWFETNPTADETLRTKVARALEDLRF